MYTFNLADLFLGALSAGLTTVTYCVSLFQVQNILVLTAS